MKHIRKTRHVLITLSILAGLSACQQQALDPAVAQFQEQAGQALGTYARRVNAAFNVTAKQHSKTSGIRGFWGAGGQGGTSWGGWNPFGGDPFGGQAVHQNIEAALQNCEQMVNNIPAAPQNFYFMVASLGRCLDMVVSYRNPIYSMAYRNLDPSSQNYWTYLLNYSQPGTLNSFQGNQFGAWSGWASTGGIPW